MEEKWTIGSEVNQEEYTQCAIFCNSKGDRHIEREGDTYVIVANPTPPEPTLEERVVALETKYGMNRWQREGILAEGSLFSEYTKAKAQEIETLAEELRQNNVESD